MTMKFFSANKLVTFALFAAVIVLAGCLGGQQESVENETEEESTQTPIGSVYAISIKDNAYSTTSLTISAGNSVTWTNQDERIHQVQLINIVSSPVLLKDGTWTYAFYEKGTYAFRDAELPYMTGTITVQ
jgi:plastocyanin